MARLRYLDASDLQEEHRRLLERPANLFRLLVHSPEGFRNFSRLGGWIRNGSTLDGRLRELAILQVGYVTGAEYEWTHHIRIGRDFGVTDDDLRAIAAETDGRDSGLPDLDRRVLRFAREVTRDLEAPAADVEALRQALGEEHLVDLLLTVAFYNLVVRVLHTLDVDLEADYRPLLEEFPLPSR
jgi:alkylhydroperoxidase family enzyme